MEALSILAWYDRHVLPYAIDVACGIAPVRRQREQLVPLARGHVLEIGIGTGRNLPYYDRARVGTIVGLDPATQMHRLALRRARKSGLGIDMVAGSAQAIPFDDATFDSVLMTYSLCSMDDPLAALREMRRVLKPHAPLFFCEHGRAPDPAVRRWQERLTPGWSRIAGGCHLDRDIGALLTEAGMRSADMRAQYLRGPRPFMFTYWGSAHCVK
jgi:ubiquinone/menaquinone biosynthesis C-methylase UbiE